jgi:hypothetical protein
MPMFKKGDPKILYKLYCTSIPSKVFTRVIQKRLREKLETAMEETQHGFRKGTSTQDPIFILRQTGEKLLRKGKEIHLCFIHRFKKGLRENKKK